MSEDGLVPKQITDKNGKVTTVWVKPDIGIPAGSKEQLSTAPKLLSGTDDFVSADDGKPLSDTEQHIASMVDRNGDQYSVVYEYYDDTEDLRERGISPEQNAQYVADEGNADLDKASIKVDEDDYVVTYTTSDPETAARIAGGAYFEGAPGGRKKGVNIGRVTRELESVPSGPRGGGKGGPPGGK